MEYHNEKDGSEMVLIPAGEFLMGSEAGFPAERPVHRVFLDAFYLSKYPVTNAQYERFVAETGHRVPYLDDRRMQFDNWDQEKRTYPPGRAQHPVTLVSWRDAQTYCEWAGGRLPTEAEWEKAARGGLEGKLYPWGDEIDPSLANYDNREGTTPVGSYPPSEYGLYDMAGNVWEWCSGWYRVDAYADLLGMGVVDNPQGPDRSWDPQEPYTPKHSIRGGSFLCHWKYCSSYRPSARRGNSPDSSTSHQGIRCVVDPDLWRRVK